jgi:hypothetical protein
MTFGCEIGAGLKLTTQIASQSDFEVLPSQ